jgi:hypothetical protein
MTVVVSTTGPNGDDVSALGYYSLDTYFSGSLDGNMKTSNSETTEYFQVSVGLTNTTFSVTAKWIPSTSYPSSSFRSSMASSATVTLIGA